MSEEYLERLIEELSVKISSLEEQFIELKRQIPSKLKGRLEDVETKIEEAESKIDDLESSIDDMK